MKASREQLKSLARLKSRAEFLRVQNGGTKWVAQSMVLQIAGAESGAVRYGLTVSKKLEKSAVRRNRIRRRLRAAACDVLPLHAKPGDYVLIGRSGTAERPYQDLCRDLKWCLEKTGCLK